MVGLRSVREVANDIKELRIQGARRIARAAVDALYHAAEGSKAADADEFYQDLLAAAHELEATRPTEPMMRNALEDSLRYSLSYIRTHPAKKPHELAAALKAHQKNVLERMDLAAKKIAKIGAAEIMRGAHLLIHCHSSTIVAIIKQAQEDGKNPHVTCLETRPLFQGRLTARELAAAGVDTCLAVDSSAGLLMHKTDLVLVGADAITAEGDLVNKIGTYTLAQLARLHSVRFMCAAELYKYDPLTRWGKIEPIEQRHTSEVWGDGKYAKEAADASAHQVPKNLRVLNPAFDRTPARYVGAYITEEGLIPPAQLAIIAEQKIGAHKYSSEG